MHPVDGAVPATGRGGDVRTCPSRRVAGSAAPTRGSGAATGAQV
jgi:hypothetical protein